MKPHSWMTAEIMGEARRLSVENQITRLRAAITLLRYADGSAEPDEIERDRTLARDALAGVELQLSRLAPTAEEQREIDDLIATLQGYLPAQGRDLRTIH